LCPGVTCGQHAHNLRSDKKGVKVLVGSFRLKQIDDGSFEPENQNPERIVLIQPGVDAKRLRRVNEKAIHQL